MSSDIINIIAYSLSAIIFLLLCVINKKMNLKHENRYRQVFMPAVAISVSVVLLTLHDRLNELIYDFVSFVLQKLGELVSIISPNIGNSIASSFDKLQNIIPVNILRLLLVNIIVMITYLILKRIILTTASIILHGTNDNPDDAGAIKRAYLLFTEIVYEYDNASRKRYLKEEYVDFRTLLSAIYTLSVLTSITAFSVCLYYMIQGKISTLIYPVVIVIIIGELYFIFGGLSKREVLKEIDGEDDGSVPVRNFIALQRILHQLFGDKSIAYGINTFNTDNEFSINELLVDIKKSNSRSVHSFANFLSSRFQTTTDIDRNIVASVLDLIRGQSVLFSNPFYQDLSPYIFYPLNRALLKGGKALVICGRHGIENKIMNWVRDGVTTASNTEEFWRTTHMGFCDSDTDIGILSADDICTVTIRRECREFLNSVRFVIIIEPSKLITTGQIGLNAIVREINSTDVTYCACDKVCDGLVDALSHALLVNITEVAPARVRSGLVAYSAWSGDTEHLMRRLMPSISRYLGSGIEISFVALRNQIERAVWFGGEAFPVIDMHWIALQYLQELSDYAGIIPDKMRFNERFICNSDMWSADIKRINYVIVEDEAFNLFEAYNNFSSRSIDQGYVNVISPQYLLKDYMADNKNIFATDRKAIPLICGDFARTERNIIIRLILLLTSYKVNAEKIRRELSIIDSITQDDEKSTDLRDHLWHYIVKRMNSAESEFESDILKETTEFNFTRGKDEHVFFIDDKNFAARYVSAVKTADYITESETGNYTHIGSELYGHVFQKYLPGQKMTYAGKYYEVLREVSEGKILLRRAADHINERTQYRQVHKYTVNSTISSKIMGDIKTIDSVRISAEYADFSVSTQSYYELAGEDLLSNAKLVEVSGIPDREYKNKRILKIELSECTDEVRYTLAVLMNEIFVTLFAENRVYISAVTEDNFAAKQTGSDNEHQNEPSATMDVRSDYVDVDTDVKEIRRPLFHSIDGNYDRKSIYIFEDSDLDIGLLDAVERNLRRTFEIAADFLSWHNEKLHSETEIPSDDNKNDISDEISQKKHKKNIFKRILEKIKKLFTRKKKHDDIINEEEDIIPNSINNKAITSDNKEDFPLFSSKKPYSKHCYLKFGYPDFPHGIDVSKTYDFLVKLGYKNNYLFQVRHSEDIIRQIERTYKPYDKSAHLCDFCGRELSNISYDVLSDGRERCANCSRTAITKAQDFVNLFNEVLQNFESVYNVKISVPVQVRMTSAKKIAHELGKTFVATPGFNHRAIGLAIENKKQHILLIEGGAPMLTSISTIAHELTHIWQYANWDRKMIVKAFGKDGSRELYEGMAVWAEIQFMIAIGETAYAKRQEIISYGRNDEYGSGFRKYIKKYPFAKSAGEIGDTPYLNVNDPLKDGSLQIKGKGK